MISILLLQFILCISFNVYVHVLAWHFTMCYACMYKSTLGLQIKTILSYPILYGYLARFRLHNNLLSLDPIFGPPLPPYTAIFLSKSNRFISGSEGRVQNESDRLDVFLHILVTDTACLERQANREKAINPI